MSKTFIIPVLLLLVGLLGGLFMYPQLNKVLAPTPTQIQQSTPAVSTVTVTPTQSPSRYCEQQGGTVSTATRDNGSQYQLCNFEDAMSCEIRALQSGACPVGGVKTTGFDTDAERFCAWVGGKTLATQNPTCTLPNGTVCDDEKLYNGKCVPNNQ
jgi:putative hemolysin